LKQLKIDICTSMSRPISSITDISLSISSYMQVAVSSLWFTILGTSI